MERMALVIVALVVATNASAQHSNRQECKGILRQARDGGLVSLQQSQACANQVLIGANGF